MGMRDISLDRFIQDSMKRPFEWGVFDCALFVSDWCKVNGFDPAHDYRGKYKTEIGAKRALLKRHGCLEDGFDHFMSRVDVNFAQKGDICCADLNGTTMGIIAGRGGVWFKAEKEGVILMKVKPSIVWRLE